MVATNPKDIHSVYDLSFLIGQTTYSLLHGQGLLVCTAAMGTAEPVCFRSGRMPLASSTLGLGVELFGDHLTVIRVFKNLLFLLPLWGAVAIVLWKIVPTKRNLLVASALLVAPFFVLNYLIIIVNVEWEEGYIFGVIALAIALLLFRFTDRMGWVIGFGLTLALLYISKSSMLPAVLVLLLAAAVKIPSWGKRIVLFVLVGLAPLSWMVYQHHASGRYSIGTSFDGLNLDKGNNAKFHDRYPPHPYSLDPFDWELSGDHHFADEWDFNDWHLARAKIFILSHPGFTAVSEVSKVKVMLFSFDRYGVRPYPHIVNIASSMGMVIFRLLLWASLLLGLYAAFTGKGIGRYAGLTYLLFVGAYCFPYLVGFGYMRHAIVLLYPAVLVCCLPFRSDEMLESA